jgi:hypothetical protein
MDWDLWCGPAPVRPYHPTYHPGTWRAWCDVGTGALGDMGCHIIDPLFLALKLRYPESVEGNVSTGFADFGHKSPVLNECFPRSSIVRYRFPARGDLPLAERDDAGAVVTARVAEHPPSRRLSLLRAGPLAQVPRRPLPAAQPRHQPRQQRGQPWGQPWGQA